MNFNWQDTKLLVLTASGASPLSEFVSELHAPTYCYSKTGLVERCNSFRKAVGPDIHIHYAMKANDEAQILHIIRDADFGVDAVSWGEVEWAMRHGIAPEDIVFSGVGKSVQEISAAIQAQVGQINIESLPELRRVADLALHLQTRVRVGFRFNPDVAAETHPYIRTGFRDNKFGIDDLALKQAIAELKLHAAWPSFLDVRGLSLHIGSQIFDVTAFSQAIERSLSVLDQVNAQGFECQHIDVGGGLGVAYMQDEASDLDHLQVYGAMLKAFKQQRPDLVWHCEPGRWLVARSGVLLTRVEYVKRTAFKTFVVVDSGMHHFMRPMLYQAQHRVLPLVARHRTAEVFDVVGPICESADVLASQMVSPLPDPGDWLAVMDVGAYGTVMQSDYNRRPRAQALWL